MINDASFKRLSQIQDALLKLTFADHQEVVSFKVVNNGVPVIEVTPGYTESEDRKNNYSLITKYGCKIIWPDVNGSE